MAEYLVSNGYNDDSNPGRTITPEPMRLAEPGWAQPVWGGGEAVQRRERDVEDEELEHARAWLAHLQA